MRFFHGPTFSEYDITCSIRETYNVSKDADLMLYISILAAFVGLMPRTLRTSSALRCNAMSFSGFTTGII